MFPSRFKKSHSIDFYRPYLNEKKKKSNCLNTGFNTGFLIGLFFVDLQKAFETTDYNILI